MKNAIQLLEERANELEERINAAQSQANSAKSRVIILQEAVELLVQYASVNPEIKKELDDIMSQL